MKKKIYGLSLGSNIAPEKNIPRCIKKLKENFDDIVFSSTFETPPVGPVGKANFWNLAALIKTSLSAEEMKAKMLMLENELGRVRDPQDKNCPRVIDIDVLPKRGYAEQAFVVHPMAEIAPEMVESFSKKTYQQLAEETSQDAKSFKKIIL
jgi:2-amino-4-hydroxy-6-hydroxymethyldihydropteridine diphosphokinase